MHHIKELLALLDIKGAIITADAMKLSKGYCETDL
jgi:predicted transposase YbfD/YdcC